MPCNLRQPRIVVGCVFVNFFESRAAFRFKDECRADDHETTIFVVDAWALSSVLEPALKSDCCKRLGVVGFNGLVQQLATGGTMDFLGVLEDNVASVRLQRDRAVLV